MKKEAKFEVFEKDGEFVVVEDVEVIAARQVRVVQEYFVPCTIPFDGIKRTIPMTVENPYPTFKKLGDFTLKKTPKTIKKDFLRRKFPQIQEVENAG